MIYNTILLLIAEILKLNVCIWGKKHTTTVSSSDRENDAHFIHVYYDDLHYTCFAPQNNGNTCCDERKKLIDQSAVLSENSFTVVDYLSILSDKEITDAVDSTINMIVSSGCSGNSGSGSISGTKKKKTTK